MKYEYQTALFEMQSQNVATKNGLNIFEHVYASNIYIYIYIERYLVISYGYPKYIRYIVTLQ